eukprot:m.108085 g.108085  ORF g.108085 m.108085 type:complete len:730 (-) comp22613_c0_seq8:74-2263(-)
MDFSAFSSDEFDVKGWLNRALQVRDNNASLESHAQMLLTKLQLFVQEVNKELEDTSTQVGRQLPSVVKSIDLITQEVSALKTRMSVVKHDIEQVEADTAQSMALLVRLDHVKERMEATSGALQEADNWTTLNTDIENAFADQDVKKAATTLLGMQRSLLVLSDVPDFRDRQRRLASQQNKLEALMGPRLVDAFTQHNTEVAREYLVIFRDMKRLPQFYNYYHKSQKASLLKEWTKLTAGETPVDDWLAEFYDLVLQTHRSELGWAQHLFDDPEAVVALLIVNTLAGRRPALAEMLDEDLQHDLNRILTIFGITNDFLQSLAGQSTAEILPHKEEIICLAFQDFSSFQLRFGELQGGMLLAELDKFDFSFSDTTLEEGVSSIREAVPKLFSQLEEAIDNCFTFTAGAGAGGLVEAAGQLLSALVDKLHPELQKVFKSTLETTIDVAEDEREDWMACQHALKLVQTCGEIIRQVQKFDESLCVRLMDSSFLAGGVLKGNTVGLLFDYLHDHPAESRDLSHLYASVRRENTLCKPILEKVIELNNTCHTFAFRAVLSPLTSQFETVPQLAEWSAEESNQEFSLSPLQYITQVGEQLLTLPQQFEPFMTHDEDLVAIALKYSTGPFGDIDAEASDFPQSTADKWLAAVAQGVMTAYRKCIFDIQSISALGAKQLCYDIDYLCNVLSALDVSLSEDLSHINQLLSLSPTEFSSTASSLGAPPEVVKQIKTARGL